MKYLLLFMFILEGCSTVPVRCRPDYMPGYPQMGSSRFYDYLFDATF